MEIISEPAYTTEEVTDFDIVYVGGLTDMLTLRADDRLQYKERTIEITIAQPEEIITIVLANVLSYKTRDRVIRRPIKTEVQSPRP